MKINPGNHIVASQWSDNYVPNCYPPTSAQPGQVWYDSGQSCLIVYDGSVWIPLNQQTYHIGLDYEVEQLISNLLENKAKVKEIYEKSLEFEMVADALKQLSFALKLCDNLGDPPEETK